MKRLAPTLLSLGALFALSVFACGRSEIYREPEDDDVFGLDGGKKRDGGTDAGRDPWFECDVVQQDCAADAGACFYYRLFDGGIGSRCVTGECDLVTQDCAPSSKCGFARPPDAGAPQRVCVPDGTREEGQSCSGDQLSNDCRRGLTCAQRSFGDGGSELVCRRFCFSSATCTSPQICYALVNVPDIREIPLTCESPPGGCSLLTQNCGRQNEACYPGVSNPLCFPEGQIPNGGACTFSNDCRKGSACFNDRCRPICAAPSGTPACEAGITCHEIAIPGLDGGVGACF